MTSVQIQTVMYAATKCSSSSILVNSSPPLLCDSEPCQTMACRLLGANPLPEPTLTYCQPRLTYLLMGPLRINISKIKSKYETLHSREFIWKVVCEIVAFLSREGWVKTCFVVSLWVFLLCPVLPSPSFSWHAQTGSAGRCLCDAAVTTPSRFSGVDRPPWHHEAAARNPAPTRSWDDCAGARPTVLGFELVLPGIMRPLSYPPTLRAVLWHTRLWVQWWHWWLLYISNKLSIFHIILFESIML